MIRRRWSKQGGASPIEKETGFALPDPNARTLVQLADVPCLVLVGDSGLGKSYAIDRERDRLEGAGESVRAHILYAAQDLEEVRDWLREAIEAARGGTLVHLFLDGLDEITGNMRLLVARLTDALLGAREAIASLRLRIVCRTAALPLSLPESFARAYGASGVETWSLLPLQRDEVRPTARVLRPDIDDDTLARVMSKQFAPMASRPLSLRLLLDSWRDPRQVSTGADVYAAAVLFLAKDPNKARHEETTLDAQARLALARKLAVLAVLGERRCVALERDASPSVGVLTLGELHRVASAESIREVVTHSQLFTGGEFFHRSVAEWLAAEQLASNPDRDVVVERLFQPDLPQGRVVPQLRGLALVLARRRRFFARLVERDPFTLLDLAPADLEDEQREALFDAVFSYHESNVRSGAMPAMREALFDAVFSYHEEPDTVAWSHYLAERLAVLAPRSLASRLEAWIANSAASLRRRWLALEVASEARVVSLVSRCLTLAASNEDRRLRIEAVRVVSKLGSDAQRAALRPLVDGDPDDVDDEMKGTALATLWPSKLSTDEMLSALTPPRNRYFIGAYSHFVWSVLPSKLAPADVARVLAWCAANQSMRDLWPPSTLLERVIAMAVEQHGMPEVADALVRYVTAREAAHAPVFADLKRVIESLSVDRREHARRAILTLVIEAPPPGRRNGWWRLEELAEASDIDWLIDQTIEHTGAAARAWIDLATRVYWQGGTVPSVTDRMLTLAETSREAAVREHLSVAFAASMLDDESVKMRREAERERARRDERIGRASELRREAIVDALARATGGDPDGFCLAVYQINTEVDGDGRVVYWRRKRLSRTEWWTQSDERTRATLLRCALAYLAAGDPERASWFGRGHAPLPATAGREAQVLLYECDRDAWERLDDAVIERWIPALLDPTLIAEEAPRDVADAILRREYRAAPDTYRRDALALLRGECEEGQYPFSLRSIEPVLDASWRDGLDEIVRREALSAEAFRALLRALSAVDLEGALSIALSTVNDRWEEGGERVEEAASFLLRTAPDRAWGALSTRFEAHVARGAAVVRRVDERSPEPIGRSCPPFSDAWQLAGFYRWCHRALGALVDPDPRPGDGGWVEITDRRVIERMLPSVRARLASLGTPAALAALSRLREELPDDDNLPFTHEEARERVMERDWRGWTVADLVRWFCLPSDPVAT